jgi:catechol-2,3-dioxygenase
VSTPTEDVKPRIRRTHIALYVKNPFEAAGWYKDVLGMIETARGERWVFLSFGTKHHDVALIQADPTMEGAQARGEINLQHYGLRSKGRWTICAACTGCCCARTCRS